MKVQLNTRIDEEIKARLTAYLEKKARGRVRPGELQDLVAELLEEGISAREKTDAAKAPASG